MTEHKLLRKHPFEYLRMACKLRKLGKEHILYHL